MTPIEIKIELIRAGITQADIARRCEPPTSRQFINQVIAGRRDTPRIRECIAAALGLPVEKVFPTNGDGTN